jgi:anti-sigma B factor antagonist
MKDEELIKVEQAGSGVIISVLLREVEMFTAPALREELEQHVARGPSFLILDFSNTLHLDSSGLAVVYKAYMNISSKGGEFCVTGLNKNLSMLLQMFNQREEIKIYPSIAAGREALGV